MAKQQELILGGRDMSICYDTILFFFQIFNFLKKEKIKKVSQAIFLDLNRTKLDINNETVNEKLNHLKIKTELNTFGTKCKSKFLLE